MDADIEISKPGESSHSVGAKDVKITTSKPAESSLSVAAKDVSFKITTRNDTLIKAMLNFHHDGEEACISTFPQYSRNAMIIMKNLVGRCRLALDNYDTVMVGKELLEDEGVRAL